ncbi:flagellar assembly peptidoglycan hydrolase FlgJ [Amphibiibacter pelophylacis]|uniref:Flagellar assembly peptidoglycan hydrolase FlgJ n=1 Tax=Amphibiibacter pelophylacis TaxID=1799477 RepID=A0ACC6P4J7_9BURK
MDAAAALNQAVLTDGRSLDALKTQSSKDPKAAIRVAAKQFEALFMQEVLKSMRQATLSSGMMENSATQMGRDMLDTQYAATLSGRPGGLGDLIAQQLERQLDTAKPGGHTLTPISQSPQSRYTGPSTAQFVAQMGQIAINPLLAAAQGRSSPPAAPGAVEGDAALREAQGGRSSTAQEFVREHRAAAEAAAAQTGIPASFLIGQAAHESGWGRRQILNADGTSSNNLFGIKAGRGWTGPTTDIVTTEYENGVPRKLVQRFRAYASTAESFADYARLMLGNPRYAGVVAGSETPGEFARGLQAAGYATDPAYASKLERVIRTAQRLQDS